MHAHKNTSRLCKDRLTDKMPQSPGKPQKFTETCPTWAAKAADLLPHTQAAQRGASSAPAAS